MIQEDKLKEAQRLYETANADQRYVLERLFPELKEIEDEKIRKDLITFLDEIWHLGKNANFDKWGKSDCSNWIAWLEKQGEQKPYERKDFISIPFGTDSELIEEIIRIPKGYVATIESNKIHIKREGKSATEAIKEEKVDNTNKVEPKFKVGDWVACENLNTALIVNIVDDKYEVEFIDGNKGFIHIDYIDRLFHLWTIQDVEDGDIIYVDNTVDKFTSIKIVSELENETLWEYCSVWRNWENLEYWEFDPLRGFTYLSLHDFHPATKKQRDLLFQKMKEAGYKWNADKKELKKLN